MSEINKAQAVEEQYKVWMLRWEKQTTLTDSKRDKISLVDYDKEKIMKLKPLWIKDNVLYKTPEYIKCLTFCGTYLMNLMDAYEEGDPVRDVRHKQLMSIRPFLYTAMAECGILTTAHPKFKELERFYQMNPQQVENWKTVSQQNALILQWMPIGTPAELKGYHNPFAEDKDYCLQYASMVTTPQKTLYLEAKEYSIADILKKAEASKQKVTKAKKQKKIYNPDIVDLGYQRPSHVQRNDTEDDEPEEEVIQREP